MILFDAVDATHTRLRSFGIGYTESEEMTELLGFFLPANRGLYASLRTYLEQGEPRDWTK